MNEQQNNIDDDHQWKGQDHLQPPPEHLPSSTSCSHRPAPWWMMLVVSVGMMVRCAGGRGW